MTDLKSISYQLNDAVCHIERLDRRERTLRNLRAFCGIVLCALAWVAFYQGVYEYGF